MPDRLTIDVTVARDFLEPDRDGYDDAVALFDLARQGEVELSTAPQGYRLDVEGELADRLREVFATEGVREANQLAYPSSVTFLPFILGHTARGFPEVWDRVAATWRSHEGKLPGDADRFHVETHVADRRDVLLTSDRALLARCRRLRDEYDIDIVTMTVADYLEQRGSQSAGGESRPGRRSNVRIASFNPAPQER
jgi:hypothetical protein